ncbi:hypothetical protein AB3331_03555 [Streptococcus sp. H49]|uniref:hypothetical protein n=1 Tax=Streptococcus huangxiaojuni TaxID=3237239 RepID=UPI0034A27C82
MASDAGITMTAIFFTRILGRVQLTRYKDFIKSGQLVFLLLQTAEESGTNVPDFFA